MGLHSLPKQLHLLMLLGVVGTEEAEALSFLSLSTEVLSCRLLTLYSPALMRM